jgi:hypothetical protein
MKYPSVAYLRVPSRESFSTDGCFANGNHFGRATPATHFRSRAKGRRGTQKKEGVLLELQKSAFLSQLATAAIGRRCAKKIGPPIKECLTIKSRS